MTATSGDLERVREEQERATRPLDVLFVMRQLGYLLYFQSSLELLIRRGHRVRLLLENARHGPAEQRWLDEMRRFPTFTCDVVNHFSGDVRTKPAIRVRRAVDYARLFGPAYRGREHYRTRKTVFKKVFSRSWSLRVLTRLFDSRIVHAVLWRALLALDHAMPMPDGPSRYVRDHRADVVAVCDHGRPGSLHSNYVKAARELGIPVALCVASWDNLTTRQLTRVVPDLMIVWNKRQVLEAVDIHHIPADRVAVTGAARFDEWFAWRPSLRSEFCAKIGLDSEKRFVVWLGGALNRHEGTERTEAEFALEWLDALRSSSVDELREIGVLFRPHPLRLDEWSRIDVSRFADVAIYPREGMTLPIDRVQKGDYFDSIYHSEVVLGINSTAMIEAAIVGRPVLGVLVPEFHESQLGTFHFEYLLESSGGAVRVGRAFDEHFSQLVAALRGGDDEARRRARRFVERFVRPRGIDRPATPIVVETIERLAEQTTEPLHEGRWIRPVRSTIAAGLRLNRLRVLAWRRVVGNVSARTARSA